MLQGKQAMDWVCQKVKDEATDLCRNLERNLEHTFDNIKNMDTKLPPLDQFLPNKNGRL